MRLVRIWKGTAQARGTHNLEMIKGGSCQAMERSQPLEGHSLPVDSKGRDLSGHGKRPTEQGALTNWRVGGVTFQDKEKID